MFYHLDTTCELNLCSETDTYFLVLQLPCTWTTVLSQLAYEPRPGGAAPHPPGVPGALGSAADDEQPDDTMAGAACRSQGLSCRCTGLTQPPLSVQRKKFGQKNDLCPKQKYEEELSQLCLVCACVLCMCSVCVCVCCARCVHAHVLCAHVCCMRAHVYCVRVVCACAYVCTCVHVYWVCAFTCTCMSVLCVLCVHDCVCCMRARVYCVCRVCVLNSLLFHSPR